MICYHCGETVPNEASHCYYCGAPLVTDKNSDYEDSIDDLLGPGPSTRGYDYLDDYEPVKSRALPIALSVVAAVLAIMAGIYLLSKSSSGRERQEKLNQLTLPQTKAEENDVPLVVAPDTSETRSETTEAEEKTETDETKRDEPTSEFNPPTLPQYRPVELQAPPDTPLTPAPAQQAPAAPAAGGSTYTVVAGDSFWSVARKMYGEGSMTLANLIASANGTDANSGLTIGQVLTIPAKPATPTPIPVARVNVNHVVAAGESFWSIATKYYGTGSAPLAEKIAAANGRTSAAGVKTGETIVVPDVPQTAAPASAQTPAPASNPPAAASGTRSYVVKAGDSYWTVCQAMYGTANFPLAEKIAQANGRTINDRLNVGETLTIPPR